MHFRSEVLTSAPRDLGSLLLKNLRKGLTAEIPIRQGRVLNPTPFVTDQISNKGPHD